ncbi:hypothetical protein N1851_030441 [Merluccius polli]|uniref:Uncharacterized protein n=1 Tax=Merluccius polli TaxID=89951 RepID=A0AA47M5G8_MERPO|nr:hypothetical protein N1851_030441 [Merluccius polli]
MCKYYPYLQKVCEAFADLVPLLQMKPFLSVMHAKGHSGKCEVQWGGRNQEGAARTDMITLQARGWNLRKKSNLHKYLSQRYVKITKRTREMEQEVEALKVELGKTEEELQQWVTDVKDWAAATPNDISPDDAPGLQRVMEGLALSIQQKKMDKYRQTDSNKARQRIQSKIEKDKQKLSQAMDFYNRLVSAEDAVGPVDIILAAECPLWPWDKDSDVPLKEKKAVFDKVMLLRRLKEEDGILLKEMQQHWQFLCRCSRRLQELKGMGYQSGLSMGAYEGLRCNLQGQLDMLKRQMREVQSAYMHVVVNVVDSSVLQLEEEEMESEEDLQESDAENSDEDI